MLLAEEIDKLGNKISIYHSKLSFSPAYSFFLRQQADLVDANHILPCTFWEDETSEIVWAELNGTVVGTTCFTTNDVNHPIFPLIYTHSTSVDKQYRRQGIHGILFKYFQYVAEKYKCKAVGISAEVVSMHSVKPLDEDYLLSAQSRFKLIASIEEHGLIGGLGGAIAEWRSQGNHGIKHVMLGTPDEFMHEVGTQEYARHKYGLTNEAIVTRVQEELKQCKDVAL
jgi:hypothetical protein